MQQDSQENQCQNQLNKILLNNVKNFNNINNLR